ncbi:MAG TPA: hypothetical protein VH393_06140 [Ktedonobacterales bacterium]|jgi:hypothetical protein
MTTMGTHDQIAAANDSLRAAIEEIKALGVRLHYQETPDDLEMMWPWARRRPAGWVVDANWQLGVELESILPEPLRARPSVPGAALAFAWRWIAAPGTRRPYQDVLTPEEELTISDHMTRLTQRSSERRIAQAEHLAVSMRECVRRLRANPYTSAVIAFEDNHGAIHYWQSVVTQVITDDEGHEILLPPPQAGEGMA